MKLKHIGLLVLCNFFLKNYMFFGSSFYSDGPFVCFYFFMLIHFLFLLNLLGWQFNSTSTVYCIVFTQSQISFHYHIFDPFYPDLPHMWDIKLKVTNKKYKQTKTHRHRQQFNVYLRGSGGHMSLFLYYFISTLCKSRILTSC